MKGIFVVLIVCLSLTDTRAQNYISPGIRLSGVFGDSSGVSVGIELTGAWPSNGTFPFVRLYVADIDFMPRLRRWKFHAGLEEFLLQTGPTLTLDSSVRMGWGIEAFVPIFSLAWKTGSFSQSTCIYPFYNYTFRFGAANISEFGAYFKWYPSETLPLFKID